MLTSQTLDKYTIGVVTSVNSLVGSAAGDQVGIYGITGLTNGSYVVSSPNWDNGGAADAGAVTWGDGAGGTTTGPITSQNSVLGTAASGGASMTFAYDDHYGHLVVGRPADNKVTVVILAFRVYLPLAKK